MILLVFFGSCEYGSSQSKRDTSVNKSNKEKENDVLKKIADDNTKQINELIEQIPVAPVVIVKPKIVYVKVYEKAPAKKYSRDYIPIELSKLYANKIDSLSVAPTPAQPPHNRTLLQRIFNTNK